MSQPLAPEIQSAAEQPSAWAEKVRLIDFIRDSRRLAKRPELRLAFRRWGQETGLVLAPLERFDQALDEFMTL